MGHQRQLATRAILATLLISFAANQAQAKPILEFESVPALHQNSNDPVSEGWTTQRPFTGVSTFAVTNDLSMGIDAWAVDDNATGASSEGLYAVTLTPGQQAQATANGWALSTNLRIVDSTDNGFTSSSIFLGYDQGGYSLAFGDLPDGSPRVRFAGISTVLDLDDLDSGYHRYDLAYDAGNGSADFFVDGTLRLANIPPYAAGLGPAEVVFGSAGAIGQAQGNYNLVQFGILATPAVTPEPSTLLLFGVMVMAGLMFVRRQRGRVVG